MVSLIAVAALWSTTANASPWATALAQPAETTTVTTADQPTTTTTTTTAPVETTPPRTQQTTVTVVDHPPPMQEPPRETQFDSGFDLYLAPGFLNMPFAGQDGTDYEATYDPGYQWGLGLGYFARTDSAFAMGIGAFFEHALLNAEARALEEIRDRSESIFRVGLELRPGIVVAERIFFNLPIRGGYAANVRITDIEGENDTDLDVNHGPHVGVAGGLDVAIYRGLYVGTAAGVDFHFFRAGRDFNMHTVNWRGLIGYRF